MKKKPHEHPKFFINASIKDDCISLSYKQNQFDEDCSRLILKEQIHRNDIKIKLEDYLVFLNKREYHKLKKYIHIQKRALDKHGKARNYDAFKIVKDSILKMSELKKEFEDWFLNKEVLI